jgi:WD40 repeat protein
VAPDGARILSWDAAGAVRLWDTTQPQAPPRVWLHDKAVLGAVFSPDASRILSWGRDDMLKLWDAAESGLLVQSRAVARITGAVFAQGGSRLLSWGSDGGLSLWDDTQTAPLQAWRHDQSVTGAVLTDGDAHVLSWDRDFALTLWNLGKNAPLRDSGNILSAVFLPDGAQVIYLDRVDGALKSWDLTRAAADTLSTGHPVARAVFAPDGSRCITWAADGSASLLQPTQPALPPRGWPRGQQAKGAVFTPDGSHFLSWDDNSVTLWAADHVDVPLKSWPVAGVKGAAFAANGTRFLSWDGATVRVWDSGQSAESGKPRRIEAVDGAVFTHDGTRFLAWSGAGSVSLWDLDKSGGPADVWAIDGVKGLLFDKTDARFVSWAGDGSLALWDLGQGEPLMQWRSGSDNLLLSAVASPDLTRILSWGNAGASLWHAGLDDPKLGLAARILKLEICSATRMDKKGQLARLKMAEWLDEKYQDAQRQQSCN